MKKFLLTILLCLATSYCLPLNAHVADNNPTQFYLGEKVFIAVAIDGVTGNAMRVDKNGGTAPYILENVSGNAVDWLNPNGRPDFDAHRH